jgi:tripartite-type tricarboxylate transporter receptor subunit TctC
MIVPGPAGSAPDLAGRLLADALSRRRGHPMVVENRAGADGVIGAEAFVQTRPGEALFHSFSGLVTVVPLLHERLPFDPAADLVPIASTAFDFFVLAVAPDMPATSLAGFVQQAKARGGAFNWYASPGAPYLAFRAFQREAGLDMAYVPYRGVPAAMADLAAGRIQAALVTLAPVVGLAREGRVRLLATTGGERAPVFPEVPTSAEAGFPGLWMEGLQGLFGWRGMGETQREEWSAAVRAAMAEPSVVERLRAAGMAARGSTGGEFARFLAEHRARWAALAREFGARPPGSP